MAKSISESVARAILPLLELERELVDRKSKLDAILLRPRTEAEVNEGMELHDAIAAVRESIQSLGAFVEGTIAHADRVGA